MKKALLFLSALFLMIDLFAQVPDLDRVEPSCWWVGMKNPKLQLMVHGNQIANYTVSFNFPGVQLVKVNKVENSNYLFLDLQIDPTAKDGAFIIKFTAPGKKALVYNYELKKRNKSEDRIQGVTSKDLIYLIMPDRFSNGDITNDKINGMREMGLNRDSMYSRHGGDLQGIINHLDYLKELGITTIWCTPEIENDMPRASYHGYAVTDHYKIDPRFGTNELYKTYVEKCHAAGLKVIKDVVHNHIGIQHWMMHDLPMKDWLHQWPVYTQTTYKDATLMDPYVAKSDKRKMLDGWFDHGMPDLNQNNIFVQNYLTQNHIWWIEYAGIDGLRLDTYPYNEPSYMASWAKALKAEFPKLSIFGETLVNGVINQAFFTEGNTINGGFNTELPGVTDVAIKDAIYETVNGKFGWTDGVNRLYNALANDFVYKDPTRNAIFMDNHDMSRYYSMVGEDIGKYKSGLALLFTMRGIPEIYYGTEILMKNFSRPDGLVRSDFPGGWKGDSTNKFTAAGRTADENDAFEYVKNLANYRKNNSVLQTGKLMQYVPEKGIYVYFRYNHEKTVMVVVNTNDKEENVDTKRFNERMDGFTTAVNIITHESLKDIHTITIPAKTTFVFELGK